MTFFTSILSVIAFAYVVLVIITFGLGVLDMLTGSEFGENDIDFKRGKILCKNAWRPAYAVKKAIKENLKSAKKG